MRLYEIYNEVTALCPDIDCELDESFGAALARALSLISSERRLEGRCVIPAYGQKPLTRVENFRHHGGKVETLPLVGRAYSLIVCGKGSFTVRSGADELRYAFDTNGRLYRGFISDSATLVFGGEHSFVAYSLSTYSEVFSDDESDIPDGSGISRYSLRERCADFGGFLGMPTDRHGVPIPDAYFEDGGVCTKEDFVGEINVVYRRIPVCPSVSDTDAEIDLSEEYRRDLVLLTAAWLMIGEDLERAEYYMSFYRTSADKETKSSSKNPDTEYRVKNRWA